MTNLKVIPYPYNLQNARGEESDQVFKSYIGKSKGECIDPEKTTKIIADANFLSKKILAFAEYLEAKEKEGGLKSKLIRPLRYLVEHLPSIQTMKAAKVWLRVSEAFEKQNWDTAIDLLHKMNRCKTKEIVIQFNFSGWEDFRDNSGVSALSLVDLSSSVKNSSWVKKKYHCDMLFGVYRSLVAIAYFNRALNSQLTEGQLSSDAKKDLNRAMAFVGAASRGGEPLVVEAIRSFEKGSPIQKIEQIRQNILV